MGASDTIFILDRENRSDDRTILSITGRDVEADDLCIRFDNSTYKWQMIGTLAEQEAQKNWTDYDNNIIVKTIKVLLDENNDIYEGTVTDIDNKCFELFGEHINSNASAISKKIKPLAPFFNTYDGIQYEAPTENR